jgi:hypothetical protein
MRQWWRRRSRQRPSADSLVWNRACDYDFQPERPGDRALKAAIQFDGLTCNGGLGHALDVRTDEEVREAVASFRYFGLMNAAQLVEGAARLADEGEREALTDSYYELTQQALPEAFERHYAERPSEYDPVQWSTGV